MDDLSAQRHDIAPDAGMESVYSSLLEREAIQSWLINRLASDLAISPDAITIHEPFVSYGISSREAVGLSGDLARWLGRSLSANLLFDYPTIELVARHLTGAETPLSEDKETPAISAEPIAIVGMSCRFPGGASTPEAFWQLLASGRDAIIEVPQARWDSHQFYDPDPQAPGKMYTCSGGFLPEIDGFDAQFFGISPREALRMDPQQRLLLEVAWQAFEHAGMAVDALAGSKTGVFIGMVESHDYARLQDQQGDEAHIDDPYYGLGVSSSIAAGRISYVFDLRGPNLTIDTACSSSLVALHLACQSLRNDECNLALAGGINAVLHPDSMVNFCKMGMLSKDGRCKTFDAAADGFVFGEGCGIVVLKRLSEAIEAGDTIFALIRGSAVNQDGRSNGITAPNRLAQEQVVRQALLNAQVVPEQISYVEAHGSGTALGDPIEIGALASVFAPGRLSDQRLLVGSVKTNIGHLAGAAGIAGLIKAVLALYHQQIPAHLNIHTPNPHLASALEQALAIPDRLLPWQCGQQPRRAGVSSFGWSGTNAHVVLEEAPEPVSATSARPWQCLLFSAKTASALEATAKNLAAYLRRHEQASLADVSYTCNVGRSMLSYRHMLLCQTREEAISLLEDYDPTQAVSSIPGAGQRPVIFLFPGLGEQYPGMAYELYTHEPLFRSIVEHCAELLLPRLKVDIRDLIYPPGYKSQTPATNGHSLDLHTMLGRSQQAGQSDEAAEQLKQTLYAQPALFVIEYALAQLWISWGIRPQAMLGHSLGEYVAACISGVLSLEDALFLVTQRARLIQSQPSGGMAAVALSEVDVQPYLEEEISLAAINGQQSCVLSGPLDALVRVEAILTEQGIAHRRLQTSHAFHSTMMAPIQHTLTALVSTVTLHAPRIPYISNVTGTWITAEQATDYTYWARHLAQTVRFADGLHEVLRLPRSILLEVGPGQSLCSFARQQAVCEQMTHAVILPSLAHAYEQRSALAQLLHSAGRLWLEGMQLDWNGFYHYEQRQRLQIPTYPFEHQHYWVNRTSQPLAIPVASPKTSKKPDIADWFYQPIWKCSPHTVKRPAYPAQSEHWLIFADSCTIGSQLAAYLQQQQQDVTCVVPGKLFQHIDANIYSIAVDRPADYIALLQHLQRLHKFPQHILHLWMITSPDAAPLTQQRIDSCQQQGLYSLLYLSQAIGVLQSSASLQLLIFSNAMQDVTGMEPLQPEKATVLSFCKVLTKEYPSLSCRSIDIELPDQTSCLPMRLLEQLQIEITLARGEDVVAYRGVYRWTQTFEPVRLEPASMEIAPLKEKGVYLITGGSGGLGMALANYLARHHRAKLVLLGRSPFPEREQWSEWLVAHDGQDPVSSKIQQIHMLEELGAEVMIVTADVANQEQMQHAIASIHTHFGQIQGVFHLAGVPGAGLIQLKTREEVEHVLAPKMRGALILAELLAEEPLDFMLLYSSSIVITGGLGEIDYTAANAFLDAFSAYCRQRYAWPCQVVDWGLWCWDAWQESLYAAYPEGRSHIKRMREQFGITFDASEDVLTRILASPLKRLAVLTQDITTTIEQWSRLSSPDFLAQMTPARTGYARPNLKNPYVPPRSTDEQKIAAIWQDALGIEAVGIHDHFFELGGNSLVGMQVIARLQQEFQQELSVVNLFEGPTISTLLRILRPQWEVQPVLSQNSHRGKLRKEKLRSLRK